MRSRLHRRVQRPAERPPTPASAKAREIPRHDELELRAVDYTLGDDERAARPRDEESAPDRIPALDTVGADGHLRRSEAEDGHDSADDEGGITIPRSRAHEAACRMPHLVEIEEPEPTRALLVQANHAARETDPLARLDGARRRLALARRPTGWFRASAHGLRRASVSAAVTRSWSRSVPCARSATCWVAAAPET